MIAHIRGTLIHKSPTRIVVESGNIGYEVFIPLTTFDTLPAEGETVVLHTYMHVREDALQLYGFTEQKDKDLFRLLIGVSGIGPKLAQTVMSGLQFEELTRAIKAGDVVELHRIPGVGKKTAERLVVELRDKLADIEYLKRDEKGADPQDTMYNEALLALTALGYSRHSAEKSLRSILTETNGHDLSLEDLIRQALRRMSGS